MKQKNFSTTHFQNTRFQSIARKAKGLPNIYRSQSDPTHQPIHPLKNKCLCTKYRAYEKRTLTDGCHGHNSLEYLKKDEC